MSVVFVGAPIRALLSSGLRLHSLCVLVKILQLAYKSTSNPRRDMSFAGGLLAIALRQFA